MSNTIQYYAETANLEFCCNCDNFDIMLNTALYYAEYINHALPVQMRISITGSEETQQRYNLGERQFDFIHLISPDPEPTK